MQAEESSTERSAHARDSELFERPADKRRTALAARRNLCVAAVAFVTLMLALPPVWAQNQDLTSTAISRRLPRYPPIALAAHAEGTVTVSVMVSADGRVTRATAVSGHPLLRDATVGAVRNWRWAARKKVAPYPGLVTIVFEAESGAVRLP